VSQDLIAALIAVGIILLVAFPVHEFSHALAAYRLGDSTARFMGRLTLDPRAHFDPLGGGMLALSALISGGGFFFGYAKPTPVNPVNLEGGRRGEALVALAGPLSNLVMAAAVALPLRFILSSPSLQTQIFTNEMAGWIFEVALYFVVINVFLFLFNLLPIPPLDGWKVLTGLVDARTAYSLRQLEQYAFILIIAVFLLGGRILVPIARVVLDLLLGQQVI
jgi:Zn-dependent protease